jgi:hypothetical protein
LWYTNVMNNRSLKIFFISLISIPLLISAVFCCCIQNIYASPRQDTHTCCPKETERKEPACQHDCDCQDHLKVLRISRAVDGMPRFRSASVQFFRDLQADAVNLGPATFLTEVSICGNDPPIHMINCVYRC